MKESRREIRFGTDIVCLSLKVQVVDDGVGDGGEIIGEVGIERIVNVQNGRVLRIVSGYENKVRVVANLAKTKAKGQC